MFGTVLPFKKRASNNAEVEVIEGNFISAALYAALPAKGGYAVLRFPKNTSILDLRYTEPAYARHIGREDFQEYYQPLLTAPRFRLTHHFYNAALEPDEPNGHARIYGLKVSGFYKVITSGPYVLERLGMELSVNAGEALVAFENGTYYGGPLAEARQQIVTPQGRQVYLPATLS